MKPGDGTTVETLFWATFTAGRGVAIIISKFTPPLLMLLVDLTLNVVATAILSIFGTKYVLALWIGNCLFGSVLSPLFPASMAWANFYIKMSAMMTALAFIASAAGAFVFSWLCGYLFEYEGPDSLMYLLLGYAITATVVFSVMYGIGRKKGKRDMSDGDDGAKEETEAGQKLNVQLESKQKYELGQDDTHKLNSEA